MTAEKKERRKKARGVGKDELIKVVIMRVGGTTSEINLPEESTCEEMLNSIGLSTENAEARVNGEVLEAEDIIEDGEQVVVSTEGKIEGGQ